MTSENVEDKKSIFTFKVDAKILIGCGFQKLAWGDGPCPPCFLLSDNILGWGMHLSDFSWYLA